MRFRMIDPPGPYVIEVDRLEDDRGFFARIFAEEELAGKGLPYRFPHWNLSRNVRARTLRGLHYNAEPASEAKIVRCTAGAVWDVVVDLRPGSATRFRWSGIELTAENALAIFVPEGFAHGFVTLRDTSDVMYQMSRVYAPGAERGVRWNDPRLSIRWPVEPLVMSPRDRSFADFDEDTFDG